MTLLRTIVTGASLLVAGAVQAQTTLTLNNWLPPSHPYFAEVIKPLAEEITAVTEGRVTINILPAPLGPPPATFDLVKNGIADIGFSVQGYSTGRFNTAILAEMPFMGDDAVATSIAYARVHEAMLAEVGEYAGVKVLGVHTHGPGAIFSSSDIDSLDDISGQKFRTGSVGAHETAKLLGAVPVEGPSSKAYELISQKVADGIFFPWESVNFFRLGDLLTDAFVAEGGIYNSAFMIIMNERKWNMIPEADQALIEPLLGEALARRAGEMWNRADEAGRAVLSENLDVYTASSSDIETMKAQLAPIIESNLAAVASTGIDAQAAYDMMLAEIEKLSAE